MIKIRGGFIKSKDGAWHNLSKVQHLYIGGAEEIGYRVCLSYEITNYSAKYPIFSIGDDHKTKEKAQEQLDAIFDLREYEKYGN